mgnify:CR=1 FL=1|tara:strand:+ start:66219 stop:66893 length:675 start_codon:yes stop_codon:yes gene_type:complete
MTEFKIKSIAKVLSPYKTKFGVPRQSGLVRSDNTVLIFDQSIDMSAFEKLEIGNFIWVVFIFDQCHGQAKLQVRPPRLGGNQKIGVYATRSPFRPNNIGLSLGRVLQLSQNNSEIHMTLEGLDLADGTPVIDIKPYHPKYDKAWDDSEYWFGDAEVQSLPVEFDKDCKVSEKEEKFIKDVLSGDPRPAYHDDDNRIYTIELLNYEIDFQVLSSIVKVIKIKNLK